MTRLLGLAVSLFAIALLAAISGCNQGAAQQPQAGEPSSSESSVDEPAPKTRLPFQHEYTAADVERMRKEHPYVSLTDRLAYEPAVEDRPEPTLSEEAAERLTARETQHAAPNENLRARSLIMLHNEEVEKFIAREGFGMWRIPPPGPSYIEMPEPKPVPFAQVSPAAGDARWTGAAPPVEQDWLLTFHDLGEMNFASAASFGHVRDREHVAGFRTHGLGEMLYYQNLGPLHSATKAMLEQEGDPRGELKKERWEITGMELVSLLKFDQPAVYISETLPRMDELREADTRPLTNFESGGLEKLREGDDLAAHYTLNRIRMLGSLRATKECLQCHDARRGELLGAFSYELMRVPPRAPDAAVDPAAD